MRLIPQPAKAELPNALHSRLTFARLRRPTRLPKAIPTTTVGKYLHRLAWLFGAG